VRTASDPREAVLAFFQSAYEAGARLAGWDTGSFESTWCPSPAQLEQLHSSAAASLGQQ
jgi:hypothetical protein